jgi:hypothetical protein
MPRTSSLDATLLLIRKPAVMVIDREYSVYQAKIQVRFVAAGGRSGRLLAKRRRVRSIL